LTGFDLSLDDLRDFRKLGSRTPGHPETWMTPGIDFSTGPLGQGLASAVGLAWAERHLRGHFTGLVDHYTYAICSDGDLMEGVTSEACSWAGVEKLGKLIVFYDDNGVTIDGPTELSFQEDVQARFGSYGWQVLRCNGEDLAALEEAIGQAQSDPRPSLICLSTVIGFPAPTLSGRCEAHSPAFPPDEIARTKAILGLDSERPFQLPKVAARRSGLAAEWEARLAQSGRQDEWRRWHQRHWPGTPLPDWPDSLSTRQASGLVLQSLETRLPQLVAGSADLAVSTCVRLQAAERTLRFGVREQAMAAICNGIVAHGGLIAVGSTYFAFSDQMKPALRLAALAGLPTISVWTHDSLALGEDGPTHQPVEQLASLRAMPNFLVIRPADAKEVEQAWKVAVEAKCPVGIVLSRQTLPVLPGVPQLERGAYVLRECPTGAPTLLATGSEVHLCIEAARLLEEQDGLQVRVVSFPCWELFVEQPPEYQRQVLGAGPRLAVEAGSTLGWHRWAEQVMGLEQFGLTGPGPELFEHFGFCAKGLAQRIRTLLAVDPHQGYL